MPLGLLKERLHLLFRSIVLMAKCDLDCHAVMRCSNRRLSGEKGADLWDPSSFYAWNQSKDLIRLSLRRLVFSPIRAGIRYRTSVIAGKRRIRSREKRGSEENILEGE